MGNNTEIISDDISQMTFDKTKKEAMLKGLKNDMRDIYADM